MRLLSLSLLLPLALSACTFSYVERGDDDWRDEDWGDWSSNDDDDSVDDVDDTASDAPIDIDYGDAFTFDPDYLVIGEMQVLVIEADADLCADVVALDIGASIEVHAVDTLDTEIRVALTVDANELPGTSDVTVELSDGTRVVLTDALDLYTAEEAADLACY